MSNFILNDSSLTIKMVNVIFISIVQNVSVYDNVIIRRNCITKYKTIADVYNYEDVPSKPTRQKVKLLMDGILLYYFIQELSIAPTYRNVFMDKFYADTCSKINAIKLFLVPASKEIIDYTWNYRTTYLVRERCELEHTLSWLSTLGGAFSALGDYFLNHAKIAGKISVNQLLLAFRLGDPSIVSRCRLYLSLSLIQCRRFKLAQKIIHREYTQAKNHNVIDNRLLSMCKGIWCKLKYEHHICKKHKHLK